MTEEYEGPEDARAARTRLALAQEAILWLESGRRALFRLGRDTTAVDQEIDKLAGHVGYLNWKATGGRIEPRKTPKFDEKSTRDTYHVYLDESGLRSMRDQTQFGLFVVGAAVVRQQDLEGVIKPEAERLKVAFFGSTDVTFHEPSLRNHDSGFSFKQDALKQQEFCTEYRRLLAQWPFVSIAAVIDKEKLRSNYGGGSIDDYLPTTSYALAYHFVLERVCNLLHFEKNDGNGAIFPERSGKREDAHLQLDHARLITEGSRYVSAAWFQHQFRPGLSFLRKGQDFGTELADVVARTIADHFKAGDGAACWAELQPKLFSGHMDRIEPGERWGTYKVFPALEVQP